VDSKGDYRSRQVPQSEALAEFKGIKQFELHGRVRKGIRKTIFIPPKGRTVRMGRTAGEWFRGLRWPPQWE
jgi:hypothetical protein